MTEINGKRLLAELKELGKIGIGTDGRRTRLAASDTEKEGRDYVVGKMKEAGLKIVIDHIGNIFGIWDSEENKTSSRSWSAPTSIRSSMPVNMTDVWAYFQA